MINVFGGRNMMKIGESLKISSPVNWVDPVIDGYKNYYYETKVSGCKLFNFRAGINKATNISVTGGLSRCPLIYLDSNPNSTGTTINPWRDELYPDRGIIKYHGDNKVIVDKNDNRIVEKPDSRNSRYLLEQARISFSGTKEERMNKAVPILVFEKTESGIRRFQGYGVIERVELITQYDRDNNLYFPNYVFEICVFSLSSTNEEFNWEWIAKRCDPDLDSKAVYEAAPEEWKKWIREGNTCLHSVRRNVASFDVISKKAQQLDLGTSEYKDLYKIYKHYQGKKHEFEYLALEVTRKVIEESGAKVTPGWVTQCSNDHGVDFVLRVDIGSEKLSSVNVVVIGQAKCEEPSGSTNGKDIARTVARLKRGWIGSFVTLQSFSNAVQQEVIEDSYPLIMINGRKVVEVVRQEIYRTRMSIPDYLDSLKNKYKRENRKPEDILI